MAKTRVSARLSKTANGELLDLAVRHQLFLTRLSQHESTHLLGFMLEAHDDLSIKISRRLDRIKMRGRGSAQGTKRLKLLLAGIKEMTEAIHEQAMGQLAPRLVEIGQAEIKHAAGSIATASPVKIDLIMPPARVLTDIAMAEPMSGLAIKGWFDKLTRFQVEGVDRAVRLGVAEGETTNQIMRRIRGTQAAKYRDGVLGGSRRHAQAIVRTAVNHTTTRSRDALYGRNEDVVKSVRIVATLDSRTSPICQSQDGKVYMVGSGPRPPFHINCRTTTAPVLRSWKEMGIDLKEAPAGTRASMNGQVPASVTYGDWLKRQNATIQNEALGTTRGAMFRTGDLEITRFTDRKGRAFSLDELKRRESDVYDAATK